jgi:uncharacterized protein YceK
MIYRLEGFHYKTEGLVASFQVPTGMADPYVKGIDLDEVPLHPAEASKICAMADLPFDIRLDYVLAPYDV